jgi:transcriptional regulator with XRE-family HTH domain
MRQFPQHLVALMAALEVSQADLSTRTGISQSTISRILAGREPMPEQVGLICAAISEDHEHRVELLLAWLRDCAEVGKLAGISESHLVFRSAVPSEHFGSLAAELELLGAEAEEDEDLRETLQILARMIRSHRARASSPPFPAPSPPPRQPLVESKGGAAVISARIRAG